MGKETMNCLMIFDHLNDIIYIKCNSIFIKHINELAVEDGVLPEEVEFDIRVEAILLQIIFPE